MKPPAVTQPEPQLDNIQILLQRRAELARNKAKYALTEVDAKLLGTHSTELTFEDGQTITEENQDVTNVYRIRAGQVVVSRHGFQMHVIGRGWFIGDAMLIYDTPAYAMKVTMKAQGPVIVDQLNLAFIQNLFNIDSIMKAKFMRHLVSKYSMFFITILNDLENPTVRGMRGSTDSTPSLDTTASLFSDTMNSSDLSHQDSTSSLSSDDSNPSTPTANPSTPTLAATPSPSTTPSTSITPSTSTTHLTNSGSIFAEGNRPVVAHHHHHIHLRRGDARSRALVHAAYKSYPLDGRGGGVQTLQVKSKKLKVVSKSFGFAFKTSIEFSKINSITKIGENAVTVMYQPHKVTTMFFKNSADREEFFGLVNSLIVPESSPSEETRVQGQALTVPHNSELAYDEVPLCGGREHMCKSQQTHMSLKKGDIVMSEGDLFQRVYTVLKGHCNTIQKGKVVGTMEEGDIIGVSSLFYLRPCPVTVEVASETAELVYMPGYKFQMMLETDILQAGDLYLHGAQVLDRQISRAIGYLPPCQRILRERNERERSESSLRDSDAGEDAPVEMRREVLA